MITDNTLNGTEQALDQSPSALDVGELVRVLQAVNEGDFTVRLPGNWVGLPGKIADLAGAYAVFKLPVAGRE